MRVLLVNKTKTKEFADFIIQISRIFKIFKNLILMEANLENLIIYKPSLGPREVPHKFWTWSVQTFIGYKRTDRQTSKVYKLIYLFIFWSFYLLIQSFFIQQFMLYSFIFLFSLFFHLFAYSELSNFILFLRIIELRNSLFKLFKFL